MLKRSELRSKIDMLYALATVSPEQFITNHVEAMRSEFNGGIRAFGNLKTNPASSGAKVLQESLIKLNNLASELLRVRKDLNVAKSIVNSMINQIAQASFYTSLGNAGSGYEPALLTGGVVSPAAYLARGAAHVNNLKTYLDSVSNPTGLDSKII